MEGAAGWYSGRLEAFCRLFLLLPQGPHHSSADQHKVGMTLIFIFFSCPPAPSLPHASSCIRDRIEISSSSRCTTCYGSPCLAPASLPASCALQPPSFTSSCLYLFPLLPQGPHHSSANQLGLALAAERGDGRQPGSVGHPGCTLPAGVDKMCGGGDEVCGRGCHVNGRPPRHQPLPVTCFIMEVCCCPKPQSLNPEPCRSCQWAPAPSPASACPLLHHNTDLYALNPIPCRS